ncbi:MAG: hemolysin family protein [Gemmatimonadota bacterium]|nr:hemolysin family protein [Gemmatimonadota bacterium]
MIGTIVLLIILLALSGFFSGAEIALFSVGEAKIRSLVEEERSGARALEALKADTEKLLITILIGNNIANIGAASVATYAATEAIGSAGVGIATGVMTLLVLFFGEITPKSFATRNAVRMSLLAARPIRTLQRLLTPMVVPLEWLVRLVLPERDSSAQQITDAEIRAMTRMGHQAGEIEEHERKLIEGAFTLDHRKAWEIMTPRVEVFAWPDSRTLAEVASHLSEVRYTRIPVYEDSLDHVTGVLYLRDAYQALLSGQRDVPLSKLAREPLFVPESVTLIELLEQFRTRRIHLGVVVDEHGGIDGIVTLEDILEELVGEIVDETDEPETPIVRVNRNEVLAAGAADLREINHFFNTAFPILEHRTLNGYLLEELGRVPQEGESAVLAGVRVDVLRATETQVTRVRLKRMVASPDPDAIEGAAN